MDRVPLQRFYNQFGAVMDDHLSVGVRPTDVLVDGEGDRERVFGPMELHQLVRSVVVHVPCKVRTLSHESAS